MKNVTLQVDLTELHCLFCPTNSPEPKDIQFTVKQEKEKQHIFTF